jgi:transcriptional regulator of acetoin/glycerol metabolism
VEGDEETLGIEHMPIYLRSLGYKVLSYEKPLLKNLKDDSEREALLHALKASGYNVIKTAEMLGIHRTTLYKKAKKLNLPLSG